jgi:hypothetical protein
MPERLKIQQLPSELRVNGVVIRSVQVRNRNDAGGEFQVVINDPQIGSFPLHSGFELEMREEGSPWRSVTLEELTKVLAAHSESLRTAHIPKVPDRAKRQPLDRLDEVDIPRSRSPRLGKITGHDRCVQHVQALLYEAAIPHRVSGTVFLVPNSAQAQTILIRAGFEPSTISSGALVAPQSECAIHVLEQPRSSERSPFQD